MRLEDILDVAQEDETSPQEFLERLERIAQRGRASRSTALPSSKSGRKPKRYSHPIQVTVTEEMGKRIMSHAASQGKTVAGMMREILEEIFNG